jgi:hypothetical protein
MASKVDITIKAKDEASGAIDGISESLGGLGGSAQEAESVSSDAFGNFMDKANETMLGVAGAIYVAKEAFKVLGEVYEGTVGKVLEIAGEIEEFVRISGDAPENMSLLRIEAEKADVPFDDLYKAMENLNKNGVAPTLDNLMLIAQEYVNLQDPIAQATLLTENFGSSGDEIAPMLEAIAGGVTAVQDAGLIFTEDELQNIRDYEQATANLGLAWDGLTTTIGMAVIPSLTEFFDLLKRDLQTFGLMGQYVSALNQGFKDGSIDVFDYAAGLINLAKVDLNSAESVKWLKDEVDELNKSTDDSIPTFEEYRDSLLENAGMMEVFGSNTKRAGGAIRDITGEFQDLDVTGTRATKAIALEMASLEEQLANANLELAVQVRTFREDIGSRLYDMLRNAGLEGEALEKGIATLDTVLGTTFGKEYALELAIDDLFQQLLTDPEGFAEAFGSFEDAFFPLQESAQEAITKVMDLQSQLDALVGEYNATINITTNGSIPNLGGGGGGGGGDGIPAGIVASGGIVNAASGLAASMPYYWVGERGPEPFFPATDGRIVSNTQAMAALRGGAGANARDIANAVREGVKEAMRETKAGNVYNLTMPTSNNPADVRTAFELMEAWA